MYVTLFNSILIINKLAQLLCARQPYGLDVMQTHVGNFVGLARYLLECMAGTAQERDDNGR